MRILLDQDEIAECVWLQGLCHVHAQADVDLHGGRFIIITDNDGMVEDDILHVLAVHHTDRGSIIRDAAGEARIDELFDYIDALFPGRFGEATYLDRREFADLISVGRMRRPSPENLNLAGDMGSVRRQPGSLLWEGDEPQPC